MLWYRYNPNNLASIFGFQFVNIQVFRRKISALTNNSRLCRFYCVSSKFFNTNNIKGLILYSNYYRTAVHVGNGGHIRHHIIAFMSAKTVLEIFVFFPITSFIFTRVLDSYVFGNFLFGHNRYL